MAGMLNVERKKCARENCEMPPAYWHPQNRKRRCCIAHAEEGMVKLDKKLCPSKGCFTSASYGVPGQKRKFCAAHARPGMVSIGGRRCATEGCTKRANYGVEGTRNRQFCAEHAKSGMVNINNQKPPAPTTIKRKAGGTAETAFPRRKHIRTTSTGGGCGGGSSGSGSPASAASSASSCFGASNVDVRGSAKESSHPNADGSQWPTRADAGGARFGVGGVDGGSRTAYRADRRPADGSNLRQAPAAATAEYVGMRALTYAAFGENALDFGWGGGGGGGGGENGVRQPEAGIGAAGSRSTGEGEKFQKEGKGGGVATSASSLKSKQCRLPGTPGEVEEEGGRRQDYKGPVSSSSSSGVVFPGRPRMLQPWPKSKEAPPLLQTSEGWSAWEWRPVVV